MLKDEIKHCLLSIFAGLIVSYFFRNYWAVLISLFSGFFIDADHLIDYFLFTRCRRFDLKEFFSGTYFDQSGKVYVFAHGFEYVIILAVLGIIYPNLTWIFYSLSLLLFFHLVFDTIYK